MDQAKKPKRTVPNSMRTTEKRGRMVTVMAWTPLTQVVAYVAGSERN